jgi:hypothetical protein
MEKKGSSLSGGRGIAVCLVLLVLAGFMTYRTLTTAGRPVPELINRMCMCSETGMTFEYAVHEGDQWPVLSPFSKKKTGYPAECCYWTKDGKRKATPTYVILNEDLGKPGDTFCPDCGRLVIGHNPPPPPETPLAKQEPGKPAAPATGAPPVPGTVKPAAPPANQQSPAPVPPAAPPVAAPPTTSAPVAGNEDQRRAQLEETILATLRAKMDEMVRERAKLLKEGKPATDPQIRELEDSILRARKLLTEKGQIVKEVDPPITQAAQPG